MQFENTDLSDLYQSHYVIGENFGQPKQREEDFPDNQYVTKEMKEALSNPANSFWLKNALKAAMNRDCLDAYHDAQTLAQLLKGYVDNVLKIERGVHGQN